MSCGNRFQCGLRKPSRFQFQPDKPSNPELHNENEKRLSDLLKAREEIDKQFFATTTKLSDNSAITIHNPKLLENTTFEPWSTNDTTNTNFTPWKVPSATDYQNKTK